MRLIIIQRFDLEQWFATLMLKGANFRPAILLESRTKKL